MKASVIADNKAQPGSETAAPDAQEKGTQDGSIPLLYVIDIFRDPYAGTEGQLYQLLEHLDRSKYSPHLIVFEESDYLANNEFICPYSVLGERSLFSIAMWVKLYRMARHYHRQGVRLAHVFFNDASIICPPVMALAGIRTIISRRDMGYWYTPMYRHILRVTQIWVSGVITNSEAVKQVTATNECISPSRIAVIYNGYQNSDGPLNEKLDDIRVLRTHANTVLAVLVANIRPIKRMQDAIGAVAQLREDCPNLKLVIIGGGDSKALEELAVQSGVAEQVFFLGARSDVRDCLPEFDIGLLCSESEGFSNAIVEYMRAGLPTVCSDVGGNAEAISDGVTGFTYPMADVDKLADRLKLLATDTALRNQLGNKAREEATERFSVEHMVNQHQSLYQTLLPEAEATQR